MDDEPFRLESPPDELWRLPRVAHRLGVPLEKAVAMRNRGQFPRVHCRRGKDRHPLWAPEDVIAWGKRRGYIA
jgi:hypothetical protein